jgi:hypothetical protein
MYDAKVMKKVLEDKSLTYPELQTEQTGPSAHV